MEVPRLGIQLELQLLAYTTATATQDLSHVCHLHHSSWQRWILNPLNLSKARDQTRILTETSQICIYCATMGTPKHCPSECSPCAVAQVVGTRNQPTQQCPW